MIPRIVLAGDHPVALIGMADVIAHSGAGIVAGQISGMVELQAFLQASPCDLIVTDFRMPEPGLAGGLALLQDIRIAYPDVPLVVMTGIHNPAIHHAILSLGVKALISKSDRVKEIPEAIEDVMHGRIFLSTSVVRTIVQGGLPLDFQEPRSASLGRDERNIVMALAEGTSVDDIAFALGVSSSVVFWRKHAVMRKLGARTDSELFAYLDELAAMQGDWFPEATPVRASV